MPYIAHLPALSLSTSHFCTTSSQNTSLSDELPTHTYPPIPETQTRTFSQTPTCRSLAWNPLRLLSPGQDGNEGGLGRGRSRRESSSEAIRLAAVQPLRVPLSSGTRDIGPLREYLEQCGITFLRTPPQTIAIQGRLLFAIPKKGPRVVALRLLQSCCLTPIPVPQVAFMKNV